MIYQLRQKSINVSLSNIMVFCQYVRFSKAVPQLHCFLKAEINSTTCFTQDTIARQQ